MGGLEYKKKWGFVGLESMWVKTLLATRGKKREGGGRPPGPMKHNVRKNESAHNTTGNQNAIIGWDQ